MYRRLAAASVIRMLGPDPSHASTNDAVQSVGGIQLLGLHCIVSRPKFIAKQSYNIYAPTESRWKIHFRNKIVANRQLVAIIIAILFVVNKNVFLDNKQIIHG